MKVLLLLCLLLLPGKVTFASDEVKRIEDYKLLQAQVEALRAAQSRETRGDTHGTRTYHERRAQRLLQEVQSARDTRAARGK